MSFMYAIKIVSTPPPKILVKTEWHEPCNPETLAIQGELNVQVNFQGRLFFKSGRPGSLHCWWRWHWSEPLGCARNLVNG